MDYGGEQKPGTAMGARARGPHRGRRPGSGPGLPRSAGRRVSAVYGLAGLAVLALWGAWSLGVVGCSGQGAGYSRVEEYPGSLFANMRQSPGEISRLKRNVHYYKLMGQPALGLREVELAHQQYPDNLQITDLLAQNYEELGKFEAARQLYQEALTRNGPNGALANNLCFSYYRQGRWQEAESCFRQTLDHDPGNVAARNNLGLLYCRLGRQDEAHRPPDQRQPHCGRAGRRRVGGEPVLGRERRVEHHGEDRRASRGQEAHEQRVRADEGAPLAAPSQPVREHDRRDHDQGDSQPAHRIRERVCQELATDDP